MLRSRLRGLPNNVYLSFLCFFFLLTGYFILRPVRDEMSTQVTPSGLSNLFIGTFAAVIVLVPCYAWAIRQFRQRQFLVLVYLFFLSHLIIFWILLKTGGDISWLPSIFFVWLSVFNIFCVSVFWSLMSELFNRKNASAFFGWIAAGGSCGAIVGPFITSTLTPMVGLTNIIGIAAIALGATAVLLILLVKQLNHDNPLDEQAARFSDGPLLNGFKIIVTNPQLLNIAGFTLLYSFASTILYFEQAQITRDAIPSPEARTVYFANIDLVVNGGNLVIQLFFTRKIIWSSGFKSMMFVPLVVVIGVGAVLLSRQLAVIALVMVLHRVSHFAITSPTRELLYTRVTNVERYKGKNIIDTIVFRGSDAISGWVLQSISAIGFKPVLIVLPIGLYWAWVGSRIAKRDSLTEKP